MMTTALTVRIKNNIMSFFTICLSLYESRSVVCLSKHFYFQRNVLFSLEQHVVVKYILWFQCDKNGRWHRHTITLFHNRLCNRFLLLFRTFCVRSDGPEKGFKNNTSLIKIRNSRWWWCVSVRGKRFCLNKSPSNFQTVLLLKA